mgnify:CR=1 FL=1
MVDWQRINLMKASRKWILQRISALIVAPLIIWFLISLISLSTSDYNSVVNFFSKPLFLSLTIVLIKIFKSILPSLFIYPIEPV